MAEFTTKYNIGDTVYTVDSVIYVHTVSRIHVNSTERHTDVTYSLSQVQGEGERTCGRQDKAELGIYSSKQEAGEAWMKHNGLECGVAANG